MLVQIPSDVSLLWLKKMIPHLRWITKFMDMILSVEDVLCTPGMVIRLGCIIVCQELRLKVNNHLWLGEPLMLKLVRLEKYFNYNFMEYDQVYLHMAFLDTTILNTTVPREYH